MTGAAPIVIVGGGPAGAVAALALARAGIPCTVFERSHTAGAKVCGEFLSPETVGVLNQFGFPWRQAEAVTLKRLCVRSNTKEMTTPLPFSPPAQSVARPFLDAWLLNQAEAHGAKVHRGQMVQQITPKNNKFVVQTNQGSYDAPVVILATGKHAVRGFHTRTAPRAQNLIGYKMNFEALPQALCATLDDTLFLFFFRGGYGGIARVGSTTATVSLLIEGEAAKVQGCKDLSLLHHLALHVPLLQQLLDTATPAWPRPLTVANLPYGHCDPSTPTLPGLFAVGDQFAVLPSFTGTGISFALASGCMAAAALIDTAHTPEAAAAIYASIAHTTAKSVMRRAMWLHRALQSPAFAHVALGALRFLPQLADLVAKATRLPPTNPRLLVPTEPVLKESHG